MEIQRHRTWTALHGELTLSEYQERIVPKMKFKEEIPSDVTKTFAIVNKLLIHGYFEYEFLDVAITKCLQTFEMALKLRFEELNNNKKWNAKSPLVQLISWFERRSYFEVTNPEFMKHIRAARNYLSHPERYGFGGMAGLHWIETTIDLINDLYEDVDLRKERLKKRDLIHKFLENIVSDGARLTGPGMDQLIFNAQIILVNNKSNPAVYTIVLSPVFNEMDNGILPYGLELAENSFMISDQALNIFPGTKSEIKLISLLDDDSKANLKDWKSRFTESHFRTNNIRYQVMIDNLFTKKRRELHFQI